MSRPRRKEAPAAPPANGRCLVCGKAARETTAAEVPEIMPFNGRRISADELEHAARQRLELDRETCVTFWKSGISICGSTKLVGAAGDDATDKALQALGRIR